MKQKKTISSNTAIQYSFLPTGGDATLALYPRTKLHGVAIYLFQCYTHILWVCVMGNVLILLFLSEPYFGISMRGNNPWWLISYWNIACTGWLVGWSAGPNQMQIVQFNAVFAAVSFCCYTYFVLSVPFAASFNTQILECYKCEHSWVHAEQKVGGQCAKKTTRGKTGEKYKHEKRFDSEFIADLDKC